MYQLMVHWLHAPMSTMINPFPTSCDVTKNTLFFAFLPNFILHFPTEQNELWFRGIQSQRLSSHGYIVTIFCEVLHTEKKPRQQKLFRIKNLSRNVPRTSPWLTPLFCLNQTVLCGFWHIWHTLQLLSDIFWHIWHFWHPIHEACRKFWHPIWHPIWHTASYVSFTLAQLPTSSPTWHQTSQFDLAWHLLLTSNLTFSTHGELLLAVEGEKERRSGNSTHKIEHISVNPSIGPTMDPDGKKDQDDQQKEVSRTREAHTVIFFDQWNCFWSWKNIRCPNHDHSSRPFYEVFV